MDFEEYKEKVRQYRGEDTLPTIYDLKKVAQLGPEAFLAITELYYKGLVKFIHPDMGGDPEYFVKVSLAMEKLREETAGSIQRYFKNQRRVEGEEITSLRRLAGKQSTQLSELISLVSQPLVASTFVTQYWSSDYIPEMFDIWEVRQDRRAKVYRSKYPSMVLDNFGTYFWHYDKVTEKFKPVNRGIKSTSFRDIKFEWFVSKGKWYARLKSGERVISRKEPYHLVVKEEAGNEIFVLGSINLYNVESFREVSQDEDNSIGLLSGSSADDVLGHVVSREETSSVLLKSTNELVEGNQIVYTKKAGDENRIYLSWRPIAFHAISPLQKANNSAA